MRLSNNKVLITGGSKGIGLALAKRFLALDNTVIIAARKLEDLKRVKAECPEIVIYQTDLGRREDLEGLSNFIKKEHADTNVLINNAGIQFNYSFLKEHDLSQKIDEELAINLSAPMHLTANLLSLLESNDNSAIVNISSVLGMVPKAGAPVYCSSKAGLHIFTKSIRYQLKNTKVFEVIPPLVDTSMTKGRGKGKMSPEMLVEAFIKSFEKDRFEISLGKVKLLRFLQRVSPKLADKIMHGSAD
ncbi:SDR family NAD(P)-dependent oxidoreductase [uncultured Arcticibacterium sp.]|uniref:SDR family oxidoreductase n=1 Tax=uncultured Arcticibacterium sp. TaxID=2173042 RepID=UPI0030F94218